MKWNEMGWDGIGMKWKMKGKERKRKETKQSDFILFLLTWSYFDQYCLNLG